jgi:SOS response regulatory protein OraA/RecX
MPEQPSKSDTRASLIKYAAFCLSRRPYFEESIRQKLVLRSKKLKFKDTARVISDILKDLKKSGYLDDPYLAQAFARRQLGKGYGPRIISLKLGRMKLDRSVIDLALEEADIPKQVEAIKKYALKYQEMDKYRLTSRLYSRGFTQGAINKLFDSRYIED